MGDNIVKAEWTEGTYFCHDYDTGDYSHVTYYKCSNCGAEFEYRKTAYCPSCGSKMNLD